VNTAWKNAATARTENNSSKLPAAIRSPQDAAPVSGPVWSLHATRERIPPRPIPSCPQPPRRLTPTDRVIDLRSGDVTNPLGLRAEPPPGTGRTYPSGISPWRPDRKSTPAPRCGADMAVLDAYGSTTNGTRPSNANRRPQGPVSAGAPGVSQYVGYVLSPGLVPSCFCRRRPKNR